MTDKRNVKEINHIRNHISCVFERLWLVIVLIAGSILNNIGNLNEFIGNIKNGDFYGALIGGGIVFLVLIVVCGWSLLRWYKTTLTVKEGMVIIERKTLNRYVNTISVQNISNINLEQNIFERIIGTYKLKLDTSSLSTANKTDVKIVLSRENAFAVKNLIIEMMNEEGAGTGASEDIIAKNRELMADEGEAFYDIIYTQNEIIKNCLAKISMGTIALAIIIAACGILPAILDKSQGYSVASLILQIVLSGSCIASIVKRWFGDYGFRVARKKNKIFVSSGLFKKKKYEVPVDKINAVSFRATLIGRLCGRYNVVAINIGGEDEDVDGMQILMAEKPNVLRERLAVLLPEVNMDEFMDIRLQPLRVMIKKLVLRLIYIVIAFVLSKSIFTWAEWDVPKFIFIGGFVILLAIVVFVTISAYRVRSTVMKDNFLIVSKGMMGRKIDLIPYDKIQYISFKQGLIDRMMKVKHAEINILASTASQNHVSALYEENFFQLLKTRFEDTY